MVSFSDPSDNRGRGWARLSDAQLTDLLYVGIKVAGGHLRGRLADRNAAKADAAAKGLATLLARRLRSYPIFGPARTAEGPTCGREGINRAPRESPPDPGNGEEKGEKTEGG